MKLLSVRKTKYKDTSIHLESKKYLFGNEDFSKREKKEKKSAHNQSLPIPFLIIIFIVIALTLATGQYYYKLTMKVSKQREAIMNLYSNLNDVKKDKEQSQMVLNEIINNGSSQPGFLYFMDKEEKLSQQVSKMVKSYNKLNKRGENLSFQLNLSRIIFLLELILVGFLLFKLFQLKRECREIELILK